MNDHADMLRPLRDRAEKHGLTTEREALDAAIAALEAGRSGEVDKVLRDALAIAYGSGCSAGHSRTVEGGFTPYTYGEYTDVYADAADELLEDSDFADLRAMLAAAPQQPPPAGDAWKRAVHRAKEGELFEEGLQADLASAGITTIAGAFMEGRAAAFSEIELEAEGELHSHQQPAPSVSEASG